MSLNIDLLMEAAGRKLGVPPEELRETLKKGDLSGITDKLSPNDREKINAVLSDRSLSEKFRRQFIDGQK